MDRARRQAAALPLLPAGTFVVQVRAGSDVPRQRVSGRVEHVMSGESQPFGSLADLLGFMARHTEGGDNDDRV